MGMDGEAGTLARARILISGRVQGVAFRAFAQRVACQHRLRGGVRNLSDGRVEALVEGKKRVIDEYVESLRLGPPLARVSGVDVQWERPTGEPKDFEIWY